MTSERGVVLIIVLMVLLLLNLFAMAMLQMVSMESKMTVGFSKWMAYNARHYECTDY